MYVCIGRTSTKHSHQFFWCKDSFLAASEEETMTALISASWTADDSESAADVVSWLNFQKFWAWVMQWWEKNGSMSNRRSGRRIEPQVRSFFASSNRKSLSHTSGIKTKVNSRRTCRTLCFYPGDSTSEFRTVTFSFEPLPQCRFFMLALGCVCAL